MKGIGCNRWEDLAIVFSQGTRNLNYTRNDSNEGANGKCNIRSLRKALHKEGKLFVFPLDGFASEAKFSFLISHEFNMNVEMVSEHNVFLLHEI